MGGIGVLCMEAFKLTDGKCHKDHKKLESNDVYPENLARRTDAIKKREYGEYGNKKGQSMAEDTRIGWVYILRDM